MQPLDDIAALPERTQALLRVSGQNPARGPGWFSKSEPLKRPHPADPDLPQRIARDIAFGPKIDHPFRPARFPGKHPIEPRPAFARDLCLETAPYLELRSRAKLTRDEITCARPQAGSDVVAADDKVGTVVRATAHENVDMGMLGIPVVDGDPVEPRAEITRGLIHQLTGKAPQAFQLSGIIRRDDEPEMMPVPVAAFRKSPAVCIVPGSIEELTGRSIAGDTVPFEMRGAGRGSRLPSAPTSTSTNR